MLLGLAVGVNLSGEWAGVEEIEVSMDMFYILNTT
jgi:hypothetical protein